MKEIDKGIVKETFIVIVKEIDLGKVKEIDAEIVK